MTGKMAKDHLQRTAYLYVRRSTLRQVIENTEKHAATVWAARAGPGAWLA